MIGTGSLGPIGWGLGLSLELPLGGELAAQSGETAGDARGGADEPAVPTVADFHAVQGLPDLHSLDEYQDI